MTEGEWLSAARPRTMLDFLRYEVSDRKLKLFDLICCQRVSDLAGHLLDCEEALAAVERFTDGLTDGTEWLGIHDRLLAARDAERNNYRPLRESVYAAIANLVRDNTQRNNDLDFVTYHAANARYWQAHLSPSRNRKKAARRAEADEQKVQAHLLRCIVGNPFRPVTADPSWLTSTVTALARGIYADRAFDRLPILADALQDAGCEQPDILAHCRGPGPHARGCWVVDLVLGLS